MVSIIVSEKGRSFRLQVGFRVLGFRVFRVFGFRVLLYPDVLVSIGGVKRFRGFKNRD